MKVSLLLRTYSISLSSLIRRRPFDNPNALSTITLALDKDLLIFFCAPVRRILLGYDLTNQVVVDGQVPSAESNGLTRISSIIFSGKVSSSLVSHFWYNVLTVTLWHRANCLENQSKYLKTLSLSQQQPVNL